MTASIPCYVVFPRTGYTKKNKANAAGRWKDRCVACATVSIHLLAEFLDVSLQVVKWSKSR